MQRAFWAGSIPVLLAASNPVAALASDPAAGSVVLCAGGRSFAFRQDREGAVVAFDKRVVRMERKPSSLGSSYASGKASLIIDKDYVAFVLDDDLGFRDCRLQVSTAQG
ncbi:MAG: hypothetical protein ABW184_02260 [Sphingobium sp.]